MKDHRNSRKRVHESGGSRSASLAAGPWLSTAAAAEGDADLVVFNAKVYTVDSSVPRADAFAVKASRFLAVGSAAEIKALIGKGTETFDAPQTTIVPGFIDCHNHAPGEVLPYETLVAILMSSSL